MSEINNHDIITKKVLSNKKYAVDFLKNILQSKIASKLNFKKLKIEKGDFIDSEGKERFTDILYSIPTQKGGRIGIFCLVEHKSYIDKNIHAQLLLYLAGIYKVKKYAVIPLVLYHGKEKWTVALNFAASLLIPDEMRDELKQYIPDFHYDLFDLRSDKTDITYFSLALQAFLKSLQDIWYLSDRENLESLFRNYFKPVYKGNEKLLDDLFDYIIYTISRLDIRLVVKIAIKYISEDSGGKIMTIAEQLEKKGMEKGMQKGREEGREEGMQKGRAEVALRLLTKNISIDIISETTGLSVEEIEKIKKK